MAPHGRSARQGMGAEAELHDPGEGIAPMRYRTTASVRGPWRAIEAGRNTSRAIGLITAWPRRHSGENELGIRRVAPDVTVVAREHRRGGRGRLLRSARAASPRTGRNRRRRVGRPGQSAEGRQPVQMHRRASQPPTKVASSEGGVRRGAANDDPGRNQQQDVRSSEQTKRHGRTRWACPGTSTRSLTEMV